MSGVHQFVPMLHQGDAVGRHAFSVRDALIERGIPSQIFVETVDPETSAVSEHYSAYDAQAEQKDVLVYQFATASGLAPWLKARPETLVLNYHNVTPPAHYAAWDNGLARHQLAAQQQLHSLASRTRLGVAVSSFNESELRAAGFSETAVVPPAGMLQGGPDRPERAAPPSRGARWLSLGRLAPNKALERALMALLITRAHDDPDATLELVGRSVVPAYTSALRRFADELGLHQAVSFRGQLSDEALRVALRRADVLVIPSAHEGFGVPVVEAMANGLPVVANNAGALPDIVGDGGLVVDAADPWAFSAAIQRVLGDGLLRHELADRATARVRALNLKTAGARLADLLAALR